jgi:branched-chain amino acid transport system permease protein
MNEPTVNREIEALAGRHRLHWLELVPWLIAIAVYVLFPTHLALGTRILVMILFALSLDLLLGYAGIATLGHAAFFGLGAYAAGLMSIHVVGEPVAGLVAAALIAAMFGAATGALILRTHGLTFLMLSLAVLLVLQEAANRAAWLTGGADGLQGVQIAPVLGLFRFDLFGRTAYLYALVVLFVVFVCVRRLVHAPFGRSLIAVRENAARMEALGVPVRWRLIVVYTIAAAIAGIAGALNAQTTQQVALNVLSFELSGAVLVMLILGSPGRLYGAFIGAGVFMLGEDLLAQWNPAYWPLWMGLLLVSITLLGRGGILSIASDLATAVLRRRP